MVHENKNFSSKISTDFHSVVHIRDVSTGATGETEVAPKFSDTLTLFQPGGADSTHHWRGRT